MTDKYEIVSVINNGFTVVETTDAVTVGGPYYNTGSTSGEEKAKRRIRDLKRADAAKVIDDKLTMPQSMLSRPVTVDDLPTTPEALVKQDREIAYGKINPIVEHRHELIADGDIGSESIGAQIASDPQSRKGNFITPVGRATFPELRRPVHYDSKLNLSSAYGKTANLSAISANLGTIDAGHLHRPFQAAFAKAIKVANLPRNGYRPAHRANRFRSHRK